MIEIRGGTAFHVLLQVAVEEVQFHYVIISHRKEFGKRRRIVGRRIDPGDDKCAGLCVYTGAYHVCLFGFDTAIRSDEYSS